MIQIRKARDSDLDVLHQLSFQLGYQPSRETLQKSLHQIKNHPDYELVVITDEEKVVGWMSLQVRYRIEDVPFLQITALVTDESYRGLGFGKKLLEHAETRAKTMSLPFVGLYSSKRRTETHQFYRRRGYAENKESFFFSKSV